jgi:hypothetical protein
MGRLGNVELERRGAALDDEDVAVPEPPADPAQRAASGGGERRVTSAVGAPSRLATTPHV